LKAVVGIRITLSYPLNLPNVARNVIAHELGHAMAWGTMTIARSSCVRPAPDAAPKLPVGGGEILSADEDGESDRCCSHRYPRTWNLSHRSWRRSPLALAPDPTYLRKTTMEPLFHLTFTQTSDESSQHIDQGDLLARSYPAIADQDSQGCDLFLSQVSI